MKKTGQRLRESREQQNLTISEVSLSTKINPRVLQAMEAGNLEKLPAISFLRGFIRTYAAYLKLDGTELLNLFSEELNEKTEAEVAQEVPEETTPPWYQALPLLKDSSVTSRSLAAGGVVLLIIVIIGIKGLVDKYEREGNVSPPPENIERLKHESEPDTKSGDKLKTAEKTQPPKKPVQPEAKAAVTQPKKEEPKKEPEKQPEPPKEEKKVEKQAPPPEEKKEEVVEKTEPKKVAEAVEEKKEEPKRPAKPQEIILEALDKVDISFRIDGGRLETLTLKPEQIHTFKGKTSVAIDLSDGGAVNVIHNGIDRGVPGDLGKPKKIKYP